MNNNKQTIIAFLLLFVLYVLYLFINLPQGDTQLTDKKKVNSAQKTTIDSASLQAAKINADTTLSVAKKDSLIKNLNEISFSNQSDKTFGPFSQAAQCDNQEFILENEKLKIKFSSKGARIIDVQVKGFKGYNHQTPEIYDLLDVHLMNHNQDRFSYQLPIKGVENGKVQSQDLCFEPTMQGNQIVFRAYTNDRKAFIEQKYILTQNYAIDYALSFDGLKPYLNNDKVNLEWLSHLPKLEKNPDYERRMTSVYFKEGESNPSYCNCTADAEENVSNKIHWVSYAQQFFNTSLIFKGNTKPTKGDFNTYMMPKTSDHLKNLNSVISFPVADLKTDFQMTFFIGPNEHNLLSSLNINLEQIIPYGWSIFGVINRYVIRPMFNLFSTFIPSYGFIIILLTLLIRILLFPLQFNMLKSGVKMNILKPKMEEIRRKYKDDQQSIQMENMRMYSEYGVNPLGGCAPMLLTMPIWIALYRFFPASIEFRQKGFLWADDLVSYDSIFDFGYIPVIGDFYGDHISLFTLLWCVSMFAYLIYQSKTQDLSAGGANAKMMMYMQYAFPVIFFFALNSWAAGLTCYMLFSNLFNILQTYLVRNVIIDRKKLEAEMEHRKNNPKPKSSFQLKYEEALKQQQEQKKKK